MKTCSKCGRTKKTEGFRKDKTKKDGFHNWCKSCHSAYKKEYYSRPEVKAAKIKYRKENLDYSRDLARKYRSKSENSIKLKARNAAGKHYKFNFSRCQKCGTLGKTEKHHWRGYEYPLSVLFLCMTCHREEDQKVSK